MLVDSFIVALLRNCGSRVKLVDCNNNLIGYTDYEVTKNSGLIPLYTELVFFDIVKPEEDMPIKFKSVTEAEFLDRINTQ